MPLPIKLLQRSEIHVIKTFILMLLNDFHEKSISWIYVFTFSYLCFMMLTEYCFTMICCAGNHIYHCQPDMFIQYIHI